MTEENETEKTSTNTLKFGSKLGLKTPVGGSSRSALSNHGRGGVTVEVKKKRVFAPIGTVAPAAPKTMTKEQEQRLKLVQDAQRQNEENKKKAAELAALKAKALEIEAATKEALAAKPAADSADTTSATTETAKAAPETTTKKPAYISQTVRPLGQPAHPMPKQPQHQKPKVLYAKPAVQTALPPNPEKAQMAKEFDKKFASKDDTENLAPTRRKRAAEEEAMSKFSRRKGEDERRGGGRISINSVFGDDDDDDGAPRRGRSLASIKRAREKQMRRMMGEEQKPAEKIYREVTIPETITVGELANRMAERSADVIKVLMKLGVMATITQTIDADTAQLVAEELKHPFRRVADSDVEDILKREQDTEEQLEYRPPVVTVMGHVDHGKTSLLDALRSANVASGEAGGITQHIGAYQVQVPSGQKVTFIDTPGHAAFTAMRARGAKITDIVVLVVAANDGIMPQTIEAIHHAKAAGVPIVVAINKIDVPGANPDKVRLDLLGQEVVVESMGGDVLSVEVSAKQKINLDKLIEAILLQAEVLNLRANPNVAAEGAVIEAKMEKGRGSVATVLIQRGTLKVGDIFVSGSEWGRVRALVNERGKKQDKALPSEPVEVLGLQGTPNAGDDFIVVDDENKARSISAYRQRKEREALQVKSARGTMEQMFAKIKAGEAQEFPVVIKGDVQGSVEALCGTLEKIGSDKIKVKVLHSAVGGINDSDVTLARVSNAMIIGFNVRANNSAREMAKRDNVDIRYYSVIYDVADDIKKILEGKLAPEIKEHIIGYADIQKVFNITKVGKVAGCMVTEGMVHRGAKVRLLRDDVVIYTGALKELKRFKDDVREVHEGQDCGMSFENYEDIKEGDKIECFEVEEIAVHLDVKI